MYFDATLGFAYSVSQGSTTFSRPHDCTTPCSSGCGCGECGAPLPLVRRVPAGESYDIVWNGDYWEKITCESTCSCDQQLWAELASYHIAVQGALGYTGSGGSGSGSDPNLLEGSLDTTNGTCSADQAVPLTESPQTIVVELSWMMP